MLEAVLRAPALNPRLRAHLRLVEANARDAAFIHRLRSDPELNQHLNIPSTALEDQVRWLDGYKAREAEGLEYYFIVVHDGADAGLIRLYDLRPDQSPTSFEWGSWIIAPPRPPGLVTLSLVMALEVGFDILGFQETRSSARRGNSRMIALQKRFGARRIGEDDEQFHYAMSLDEFRGMQAANASRYASLRRA